MVSAPVVTVLAIEDPEIDPSSAEDRTETLAGSPASAFRQCAGDVDEKLPQPDPCRHDAEQHEMEHIGRDDLQRGAYASCLQAICLI